MNRVKNKNVSPRIALITMLRKHRFFRVFDIKLIGRAAKVCCYEWITIVGSYTTRIVIAFQ